MRDLSKLSGNEMKLTTKPTEYRDYIITQGGLGFTYVHKDYEGVFEYDGETGEPSEYDRRAGSMRTIEECKEEIDELEDEDRQETEYQRKMKMEERLAEMFDNQLPTE